MKLTAKKHQTALEINLSNLIRNLNYYRKLVSPKIKILVMIKAAGYGTGLIESAKVLEQNHVNWYEILRFQIILLLLALNRLDNFFNSKQ